MLGLPVVFSRVLLYEFEPVLLGEEHEAVHGPLGLVLVLLLLAALRGRRRCSGRVRRGLLRSRGGRGRRRRDGHGRGLRRGGRRGGGRGVGRDRGGGGAVLRGGARRCELEASEAVAQVRSSAQKGSKMMKKCLMLTA